MPDVCLPTDTAADRLHPQSYKGLSVITSKTCNFFYAMKHILKIMMSLLLLIGASAPSLYAQITLSVNGRPVTEVVKQIEKSTSYRFFYNKGLAGMNQRVTVTANDQNIDAVMSQICRQTDLSYVIKDGNQIVLTAKQKQQEPVKSKNTIKGTVIDPNGEPVIGATVRVKGTDLVAITDINGNYSIQAPEGSTIEVSYIGYVTGKGKASADSPLNFNLKEDNNLLNEVVVVGYGSQKKVNLTGSVENISAKSIENRPIRSVTDAIQGQMPGVTVQSGTGQPGQFSSLKIRGNTSVNSGGALVIIDGLPGDINLVNPQDIESVSVLKDAASAAIYGARAAEGVILITTRQGTESKVKVEYTDNFAFNRPTRIVKSNNSYDHAIMQNLAYTNAGLAPNFSEKALEAILDPSVIALPNGNDWIYTADTDWISMMFDHSFQQTHNLAVSKASESLRYRFSAGWLDQDGMFSEYGPDNYDRYTLRSNISADLIKNKLTFDSKVTYTGTTSKTPAQFGGWTIPYITMIQAGPNMPVYDPNGNYARYRMQANPIQALKEGGENRTRRQRIEGVFTLSYKPIKGLEIKAVGAGRVINSQSKNWRRQYGKYGPNGLNSMGAGQSGPNRLTQSSDNTRYITGQLTADYSVKIKKHDIHILAGWSAESNSYESLTGERTDIIGNELPALILGSTDQWSNSADETEWALLSGFGRINYNYDERYLFEANIRMDGSSRFSKKHRWGYFPSFSGAWRVSQEAFMADQNIFSNLKLRASWGQLGNQNGLGLYDHIAKYSVGGYYPFANELGQWAKVNSLPSEDRTWETVEMTNVGVDLGFLNNRLTAEAELFWKHTRDMLVSIEIPSMIGITVPTGNYGELKVHGWNIAIGWHDRIGKVNYSARFSLSDQKDKLTDYGQEFNGFSSGVGVYTEGYSLGAIFGYKTDGYFQTQEEVDNYPVFRKGITAPGDVKYIDLDNDGKISAPNDLAYLGSTNPRYVFGLNLTADWNGIDFSALFQGVGKRDYYLSSEVMAPFRDTWGNFSYTLHNDYWTPDNTDAALPRPYAGTSHNYQISDHWLQNAAYVRLKNLQIGYTLPSQIMRRVGIDRLRVYFSGDNLLEYSKLQSDFDPELSNVNGYMYPMLRSYSFGINLTF